MKLNVLFASLCLMCTSGFVGAMDKKKDAYLEFKLDKELHIVGHKAKNMQFFLPPSDFTGKVITEAVPLSPEDLVALSNGFENVRRNKTKEKVAYTLADMQFIAAIKNKKHGFSVKVREVAKVDEK